ncbi:MAG: hypothetical protein ACO223_04970, partial [Burkholderiaceae bacterium]
MINLTVSNYRVSYSWSAATLLIKLLPVVAHAQIIPDAAVPAKQQAILGAAANGVPLVHIQ